MAYLLQEAGFNTVGDLAQQWRTRPDDIFRLQGIGPKAMAQITKLMDTVFAVTPEAQVPVEAASVEPPTAEIEVAPVEVALPVEVEPQVKAPEVVETPVEEVVQETPVVVEQPAGELEVAQPVIEEPEPSFDELFTLKPEFAPVEFVEEEEDESGDKKGKKGKKKKKHTVEVEYDPDRDLTIVHKKHKRGDEWDWEA